MTSQCKPCCKPANRKSANTERKPKATKTGALLTLLRRRKGATLQELMKASGWQAHSVRGFLSGTVRKKLNLPLLSETDAKSQRRYRVCEASAPVQ